MKKLILLLIIVSGVHAQDPKTLGFHWYSADSMGVRYPGLTDSTKMGQWDDFGVATLFDLTASLGDAKFLRKDSLNGHDILEIYDMSGASQHYSKTRSAATDSLHQKGHTIFLVYKDWKKNPVVGRYFFSTVRSGTDRGFRLLEQSGELRMLVENAGSNVFDLHVPGATDGNWHGVIFVWNTDAGVDSAWAYDENGTLITSKAESAAPSASASTRDFWMLAHSITSGADLHADSLKIADSGWRTSPVNASELADLVSWMQTTYFPVNSPSPAAPTGQRPYGSAAFGSLPFGQKRFGQN